ncbi:MAG: DMT family transporter [Clostridia bacterium]|nr:DMT family transporter [Clostridia bacterium]
MTKKSNLKGSLILCTAALLWGVAFAVQDSAAKLVPPFAFNCLRSIVGAAFLFGFMGIKSIKNKDYLPVPKTMNKKLLLTGSMLCGIALAVSTNFQQFGIAAYPDGVPTAARSGFITALYVILVPILSVFVKKRVPIMVWIACLVAVGGFYMLCLFEGVSGFYLADILVLGCTFTFSLHIMIIDKYCDAIGGMRLSAFQFVFAAIISGVLALIFELDIISLANIKSAIPHILYMGIVSSGIAYTLQIVGQKFAEPAIASLSMSLESVFAALAGVVVGDLLEVNEIIGCILVFAAIVLAQIPEFFKRKDT